MWQDVSLFRLNSAIGLFFHACKSNDIIYLVLGGVDEIAVKRQATEGRIYLMNHKYERFFLSLTFLPWRKLVEIYIIVRSIEGNTNVFRVQTKPQCRDAAIYQMKSLLCE